jgi:hypothetical protein
MTSITRPVEEAAGGVRSGTLRTADDRERREATSVGPALAMAESLPHQDVGQRNRRLGMILLGVLLALYVGSVAFVLIR